MRKKLFLVFFALITSVASFAQFEEGKVYVNGSLSGLDLSYNGITDGHIGLQAKAGYFFMDNLAAVGSVGYEDSKDMSAVASASVGGRYYIVQNGIYLGASCTMKHASGYNDFLPGVQIGYAFFINGKVTIEPELYYDQSFKNHKDYSTVGLRIGVGIYL
jgi:hypothetical protein